MDESLLGKHCFVHWLSSRQDGEEYNAVAGERSVPHGK